MLASWKENYDQPRQRIKKQRHYFANKRLSSQGYGFSSSHVWMWELGYKESWAPKNWWFWTLVLEKTLESPLDCKEIKPVNPKGNQSWIFIGRADVEAETPIVWPPDAKSWLIWKDPDAGKDWRWEDKGTTKDEMVGWHHGLDGHEFEKAPRFTDGQGSLACCSLWGHKESDTRKQLNWTETDLESSQSVQLISGHVIQLNQSERLSPWSSNHWLDKSWWIHEKLGPPGHQDPKQAWRRDHERPKDPEVLGDWPLPAAHKFLLSQLAPSPYPACISLPDLCVAGAYSEVGCGETCSSRLWRST